MSEEKVIRRNCKNCGEIFTPSRQWQEFCGTKCRNGYHNGVRDKAVPVIKCPHCRNDNERMLELLFVGRYLCNVCAKEFNHDT
jgi:hypothetical protein